MKDLMRFLFGIGAECPDCDGHDGNYLCSKCHGTGFLSKETKEKGKVIAKKLDDIKNRDDEKSDNPKKS